MWTNWKYSGLPEIGDYVQAECPCGVVNEGIVSFVDPATYQVDMIPERDGHACWRWRLRLEGPKPKEEMREKELEDA